MNRKGFTLIELLATIAIIALVFSIATYFVSNIVKEAKYKTYQVTKANIESKVPEYVVEANDKLYYFIGVGGTYEYQCITVKDLIDYGYLDSTVTKSLIDEHQNVKPDDYVYVERDITTKTITKSVYIIDSDSPYANICATAVAATGNITFISNPTMTEWSKYKDITITYKLTNIPNIRAYENYNYNYNYSSTYSILNDDLTTKKINTTANGTLLASIVEKNSGKTITTSILLVSKIDTVGPAITNKYTGSNTVRKTVTIPIQVTDAGSGVNYSTFTQDDLEVMIGTTKITTGVTLTKKDNNGNYNIKIDDTAHDGKITITIDKDKIFDNVENGNIKTTINPNVSFNNIYKITFVADTNTELYTRYDSNKLYKNTSLTTVGSAPSVTKEGYVFNGWYTAKTGGTKVLNSNGTFTGSAVTGYTSANTWRPSNDISLYANMSSNKYTIAYNLDGGTKGTNAPTSASYDEVVRISNPTKTGYTFAGWTPSNWNSNTAYYGNTTSTVTNKWTSSSTKVTSEYFKNLRTDTGTVTLNANWVPQSYTVTLNGNGATTPGSESTTVSYEATKLGTITNPKKTIAVSFNRNGTEATIGGAVTSWSGTLTKDYTLNGWYTAADSGNKVASNATTPILEENVSGYTGSGGKWTRTSNATLYAIWTGPTITLPTVTKSGYTCKWNDKADGTGTLTYASGGTYKPTSATSRVFHAICTADEPTVTDTCSIDKYWLCPEAQLCYPNGQTAVYSKDGGQSQVSYGTLAITKTQDVPNPADKVYYVKTTSNKRAVLVAVLKNYCLGLGSQYTTGGLGCTQDSSGYCTNLKLSGKNLECRYSTDIDETKGFQLLTTHNEPAYLTYMYTGCATNAATATDNWKNNCSSNCNSGTPYEDTSAITSGTTTYCYQCTLSGNNVLGYAVWYQWGAASGNGVECTRLSNTKSCSIYAIN